MAAVSLLPADFDAKLAEMRGADSPQAADSIAATMMTSAEAITEVTDLARQRLYEADAPDYDETLYGSFARAIASSAQASDYQRAVAEWDVYCIGLNAPGSVAADFDVRQADGSVASISSLTRGEPTILFFYNPDCHHCLETMKLLDGHEMPARVFAVCIEAEPERWEATRGALPQGWMPLLDVTDVQDSELYIFNFTPAIYLLDANGIVAAKNPPAKTLLQ